MAKKRVSMLAPDKFREAILYISKKSETDPRFSMTKLNKLLFYADFVHFAKTGESITGQRYQKLNWGPCPRGMKPASEVMQRKSSLRIVERDFYGKTQKKPIALDEPNIGAFSSSEISVMDEAIELFWEATAKEISDVSHYFLGWKVMDLGEDIPYGFAWIDDDEEIELAPEEIERILQAPPLSDEEKKRLLSQ